MYMIEDWFCMVLVRTMVLAVTRFSSCLLSLVWLEPLYKVRVGVLSRSSVRLDRVLPSLGLRI